MAILAAAGHEEEQEDYYQGEGDVFGDIDCLHDISIIALLSFTINDYNRENQAELNDHLLRQEFSRTVGALF